MPDVDEVVDAEPDEPPGADEYLITSCVAPEIVVGWMLR